MAISASAVWEVRTTGADTNGGFYVSGGTDYSLQDAAQLALTDVVANGTTTLTSVTGGFTAAMIGNGIYLAGGTGTLAATRRQITGVTDTNTITVDATVAAGTGITGNVGGCLASPGECMRNFVAKNTMWIKAGTYTITLSTQNVAGGVVVPATNNNADVLNRLFGYQTTRGDNTGTRPVITSGVNTITIVNLANGGSHMRNIEIDGDARTANKGILCGGAYTCIVENCKVYDCTNIGIDYGAGTAWGINNETTGITGGTAAQYLGTGLLGCYSHDNTVDGFEGGYRYSYCISDTNTGDGFIGTSNSAFFEHCVSYGNTSDGFVFTSVVGMAVNCIAMDNGAYGYESSTVNYAVPIINCAGYSNTTAEYNATNLTNITSFITLTADPFVDAAGGNFTLNDTTPGGKDLQSSGAPETHPGNATTGKPTIGTNPKGGGGTGAGTPPAGGSGILGGGAW